MHVIATKYTNLIYCHLDGIYMHITRCTKTRNLEFFPIEKTKQNKTNKWKSGGKSSMSMHCLSCFCHASVQNVAWFKGLPEFWYQRASFGAIFPMVTWPSFKKMGLLTLLYTASTGGELAKKQSRVLVSKKDKCVHRAWFCLINIHWPAKQKRSAGSTCNKSEVGY